MGKKHSPDRDSLLFALKLGNPLPADGLAEGGLNANRSADGALKRGQNKAANTENAGPDATRPPANGALKRTLHRTTEPDGALKRTLHGTAEPDGALKRTLHRTAEPDGALKRTLHGTAEPDGALNRSQQKNAGQAIQRRRSVSLGRSSRIFRDWGIPEWFVVSQAILLAMLFVPGLSAIRFATKMASFFTSLVAIWIVWRDGRIGRVRHGYKPTGWLKAMIAILFVMIFHPGTHSLTAGTAQTVLYLSNYAVAFWGVASLRYGFQLQRVFILLFLINSFSALLGIGQFYKPNYFMPPAIPSIQGEGLGALILQYELDDGTKVIRPCGLSDTPGQASYSGAMAATMGLILLTSSLPMWQRLAGLVLAVPGATVIYLTQVRTSILMVVMSIMALLVVMIMQKRYQAVVQLCVAALIVVLGGFAWAAREGGASVANRFFSLIEDNPANVLMNSSRAQLVNASLTEMLWRMPLGGGLGRYGQVYAYFGDGSFYDLIWCETQISAWIIDGGLPMLILGLGVVLMALADTLRIARRCPHPVIRHWAAGVFAINFSLFFICFGQMPFLTNTGQQFWLLAAMTHAADRWVRMQMRKQSAMQPPLQMGLKPV